MTVLVLGLAGEPPVLALVRELARAGLPWAFLDQRELLDGDVSVWWAGGRLGGTLSTQGTTVDLDDVTGVYQRMTSWQELPEVESGPELLARGWDLHEALESWLEGTPVRVANRTSANDSNHSKPYQALLLREHFDVPETLVTTDPFAALAFWEEHGDVVYKSASGERSIVTALTEADVDRLPLLAHAPLQLQERLRGTDVRVHVVGEEVFATAVHSDGVDYRYAGADMAPTVLPDAVEDACRAVTRRLGLELSGVDLCLSDDGRVVCYEVNPSPAYTVYEEATGQPIAAALARHLGGAQG